MKTVLITNNHQSVWAQKMAQMTEHPLIEISTKRFADSEIALNTENLKSLKGAHAIVISTVTHLVHDHVMWLMFLVHALHTAQVKKITVVMPYMPYARQKDSLQALLGVFASLGVSQFIPIELHEPSYAQTDSLAVRNITLDEMIAQWAKQHYLQGQVTIVAPDQGAIERAQFIAQYLHAPLMTCAKDRYGTNEIRVTQIKGVCQTPYALIVDDIIDTGSTVRDVADILRHEHNVQAIDAFAVHGLLSGNAQNALQQSSLRKIIIANTIEHNPLSSKLQIVDLSDNAVPCIIQALCDDEKIIV